MYALILPTLAVGAVSAIEVAEVIGTKAKLQEIVDSAALNGAHQLGIDRSAATATRAKALADQLADPVKLRWQVTTIAAADDNFSQMTVTQDAWRPSFFGSLLPPGGFHLHATATAINASSVPLCVLGLQQGGSQVVQLKGSSVLTAGQCLVQSDSDLVAAGSSRIQAGAARAVTSASGAIAPVPLTDAPKIADPFANLAINVPNACNDVPITLLGGTTTLNPGVHCGSITLLGNGTLKLAPGEHYFTGGLVVGSGGGGEEDGSGSGPSLSIGGNVSIVGTDVVLIFKGLAAAGFAGNASLNLEGRKSGPYAGFVMVADRSFTGTLSISTLKAQKLLGTLYIPNGTLAVSGNNNKVADQSAWTVVVAKKMQVSGSANLVINSNYDGSPVPVPAGVGPGQIALKN